MRLHLICLLSVLLCASIASAFTPEDMAKLTFAYAKTFKYITQPEKFLACVNGSIEQNWNKFILQANSMDINNTIKAVTAFTYFLSPAFATLATMNPCGEDEIQTLYYLIKDRLRQRDWFIDKVNANITYLIDGMNSLINNWGQHSYENVGTDAGKIVNAIFIS